MTQRRLARALPVAVTLALTLAACTVYVQPGPPSSTTIGVPLDDVITDFQPTRGEGATYYLGENIEFRIRTDRSGYVTLSAMDPDGRVYLLARNAFVGAYRTTILPTREMRVTFSAAPPTGLHRVRAAFTSSPTNSGEVRYLGRYGAGAWSSAIDRDIEGYPVRDVAETTLIIR